MTYLMHRRREIDTGQAMAVVLQKPCGIQNASMLTSTGKTVSQAYLRCRVDAFSADNEKGDGPMPKQATTALMKSFGGDVLKNDYLMIAVQDTVSPFVPYTLRMTDKI